MASGESLPPQDEIAGGDQQRQPQQRPQQQLQDGKDGDDELPLELQLHEVDLSNPDLDPLEYAFRKYVPIPAAYYWDTASADNDHHSGLSLRTKLWHQAHLLRGGGPQAGRGRGGIRREFSSALNDGPFDYVTEAMTEEEMAQSRARVERRREEQERKRAGDV